MWAARWIASAAWHATGSWESCRDIDSVYAVIHPLKNHNYLLSLVLTVRPIALAQLAVVESSD